MKNRLFTALSVLSIAVFASTTLNIGKAEALTVTWKQFSSQRYLRANTSRQVYTFNGTDSATSWTVTTVATNTRLYKNNYTGKCLDSNSSGSVYTNTCSTGNKYQQWKLINNGSDYYLHKNIATGLCLTTTDPLTASTAKTATCSLTKDSQLWR